MAKKATAVPADSFSDLDEIINKEFEGLTMDMFFELFGRPDELCDYRPNAYLAVGAHDFNNPWMDENGNLLVHVQRYDNKVSVLFNGRHKVFSFPNSRHFLYLKKYQNRHLDQEYIFQVF